MGDLRKRQNKKDRSVEPAHEVETNVTNKHETNPPYLPPPNPLTTQWNIAFIVITLISLLSRTWAIHNPHEVVFDEVHFALTVHPPLGKLIIAASGYFLGFDGHFLFENIGNCDIFVLTRGDDYIANNVPYIGLRLVSAVMGSFIVSFCFLILKEMNVSIAGCLFGAVLLIFDNALISQSRLILLDSSLILFCMMSLYSWIRFFKTRHSPFSKRWWGWLVTTGFCISLAMGIKLVGIFTIITIGISVIVELWGILDIRKGNSMLYFWKHFGARALCLIIFPFLLYLVHFYIHFAILINSGPGDAFMSTEFQSQLNGSALTANSVPVFYGAIVTLKHQKTSTFLHSHPDKYPLRYDDGRISSELQQVTTYHHADQNNHWQIEPYDEMPYFMTDEEKAKKARYVKRGDMIRLRHMKTDTYLLTHDVASPMTPTNMEVTTVNQEVAQTRFSETLWRIDNDGKEKSRVMTRRDHIKLFNYVHKVALNSHSKVLPSWAFGQQEVNGNKNPNDKTNFWYFNDAKHDRIIGDVEIGEEPLSNAPKSLGFFAKFFELNRLMISHNAALTKPHPYSSGPLEWPFVVRGISFWERKDTLRQIYLLGNPLIWWSCTFSIGLFAALWLIDRLMLQRGVDDFGPPVRRWWDRSVGFLFLAWIIHWFPFFLMGRMLFLHHYLPSFIFSAMLLTLLVDFFGRISNEPMVLSGQLRRLNIPMVNWSRTQGGYIYWGFLIILSIVYISIFFFFHNLTYGFPFATPQDLKRRHWITGWDLQHLNLAE